MWIFPTLVGGTYPALNKTHFPYKNGTYCDSIPIVLPINSAHITS